MEGYVYVCVCIHAYTHAFMYGLVFPAVQCMPLDGASVTDA